MRQYSSILSSILILILCNVSLASIKEYPEWFLHPSKYPNIIVGYSYRGMPAKEVAENMYCAYNRCFAVGTLEIFDADNTKDLLKNSNYYYEFSQDSVEAVRGRMVELDRFTVSVFSRDYISAFSLDDTLDLPDTKIPVEEIKRPEWVDKEYIDNPDYYYGIGMYTSIGLENDAWQTAEEQAIFSILNQVSIKFNRINLLYRDSWSEKGYSEEISVLELKFSLEQIQIVDRYPDNDHKLFYILARIHKSNVTPLYGY
jgi:hypothetical protein